MVAPGTSLHAVQHQDDERRVLLRLAGGRRADVAEIKSDLATRMPGERVPRALQALQRADLATHEERHGRPKWWLTGAGEQRARELQEARRAPRPALPVLPEPATPAWCCAN